MGEAGGSALGGAACKLTATPTPHPRPAPPCSLVQALLAVLSQVLCFLAVKWYLPLLVSSLVLGWLNLLYYTRGLQHTGIYSVMIQKVRARAGAAGGGGGATAQGWARRPGASLGPQPAGASPQLSSQGEDGCVRWAPRFQTRQM